MMSRLSTVTKRQGRTVLNAANTPSVPFVSSGRRMLMGNDRAVTLLAARCNSNATSHSNGQIHTRLECLSLVSEYRLASSRCQTPLSRPVAATLARHSSSSIQSASETPKWTTLEFVLAALLAVGSTVAFAAGGKLALNKPKKDADTALTAKPLRRETQEPLAIRAARAAGGIVVDRAAATETLQDSVISQSIGTIPMHISPETYESSICALQGLRETMEDDWVVSDGGRFAAVFDGHSGGDVSAFLRDRLHGAFARHMDKEKSVGADSNESGGPWVPTVQSHANAMSAAFDEMDQEVLKRKRLHHQGSTAVAIALHEEENGDKTLVSANVGDSRAILSRAGHAIDLTRDHKPNEEYERARIEAMGDKVTCDRYGIICRVHKLAISRSFGDKFAKPVVTGEAEIQQIPVSKFDDEFVLLASDGLWDVMSSQDVVSFVHSNLASVQEDHKSHEDYDLNRAMTTMRKQMSSFVANEAISRGSDDNVCVVIVWLKELEGNA